MNKINMDLTGVPKTLLLPLLGRAQLSAAPNSPFKDPYAIKLIESLDYDFKKLSNQVGHSAMYWMARAHYFDQCVKKFLSRYPDAVIVSLGAGLETAFHRVDNGKLTWVDLDLPEVINLRQKLMANNSRVHQIAISIHDVAWMEEVKKLGKHFFFFAGGLFMYFTEPEVKSLFKNMAEYFPGGELVFDTISTKAIKYANRMLKTTEMTGAKLQWGIDQAKLLETWSDKIKLVTFNQSFKNLEINKKYPIMFRIKMFLSSLMDKSGIIHVRFSES